MLVRIEVQRYEALTSYSWIQMAVWVQSDAIRLKFLTHTRTAPCTRGPFLDCMILHTVILYYNAIEHLL